MNRRVAALKERLPRGACDVVNHPWVSPARMNPDLAMDTADQKLLKSTGADELYKKLQRALKAEIDEDAWSTLYSTVSRRFKVPSTGKIAVKVINHYGDEVLKVYQTPPTSTAAHGVSDAGL